MTSKDSAPSVQAPARATDAVCDGDGAQCPRCGSSAEWIDCDNCLDGFTNHDCGEDACSCCDPEDDVTCWVCEGRSGWWLCLSSAEWCKAHARTSSVQPEATPLTAPAPADPGQRKADASSSAGWRVGTQVGRTVYDGPKGSGHLIGVMDTPVLARRVVDAVNAAPVTSPAPPATPYPWTAMDATAGACSSEDAAPPAPVPERCAKCGVKWMAHHPSDHFFVEEEPPTPPATVPPHEVPHNHHEDEDCGRRCPARLADEAAMEMGQALHDAETENRALRAEIERLKAPAVPSVPVVELEALLDDWEAPACQDEPTAEERAILTACVAALRSLIQRGGGR